MEGRLMAAKRVSDPFAGLVKAIEDRLTVDGRVHLVPMAGEYVEALRSAAAARAAAAAEPFATLRGGRILEHPGWTVGDREARRALALAKLLALDCPVDAPAAGDPYAGFDEIGPRGGK
jgi:hypothetical protein